jgi:alkanesulfonate monooxygenase SsuD/methylene tetrahydromethanopterin reductase-like flavin-dependent oxidoreductase (luciferase family)
VSRAARLGLPFALAIIGGAPRQFAPLIAFYREAAVRAGHNPAPAVGINSHTYVADTSERAADEFFPSYAELMSRIGRERGWPPVTRAQFEASRAMEGALLVGSVEQVVEKILAEHELFGHQRFLAQMTVGSMPHERTMRSIELFGTRVAPAVRKALGPASPTPT